MRTAFVIAAVAVFLVTSANARDAEMTMTGKEFLAACSKPDPEWIGFCHGYVQAVYDGVFVPGEDFCPPNGLTRAKIVGMVVGELQAMPSIQDRNAAFIVYVVLADAFPCP